MLISHSTYEVRWRIAANIPRSLPQFQRLYTPMLILFVGVVVSPIVGAGWGCCRLCVPELLMCVNIATTPLQTVKRHAHVPQMTQCWRVDFRLRWSCECDLV